MNWKSTVSISAILLIQWILMIIGLDLIAHYVFYLRIIPDERMTLGYYLNEGIKASIGVLLSTIWLYLWKKLGEIYFWKAVKKEDRESQ